MYGRIKSGIFINSWFVALCRLKIRIYKHDMAMCWDGATTRNDGSSLTARRSPRWPQYYTVVDQNICIYHAEKGNRLSKSFNHVFCNLARPFDSAFSSKSTSGLASWGNEKPGSFFGSNATRITKSSSPIKIWPWLRWISNVHGRYGANLNEIF